MKKKLCILLVFSVLSVIFKIAKIIAMHILFANFVKILKVCKFFAQDLVNDRGKIYSASDVLLWLQAECRLWNNRRSPLL